jgi:polyhydroxyalkanoate synthesis regulator phasin
MEDASKDMLQRYKDKQVELYERIERELKEVQQDVCLVCAVPTTPSSSQTLDLGDELAQLRRLVDATEARSREIGKRRRRLQNP